MLMFALMYQFANIFFIGVYILYMLTAGRSGGEVY